MAKLNRERKLIEKRHAKSARKLARKQAASEPQPPLGDALAGEDG
jgi:hypothetical protein